MSNDEIAAAQEKIEALEAENARLRADIAAINKDADAVEKMHIECCKERDRLRDANEMACFVTRTRPTIVNGRKVPKWIQLAWEDSMRRIYAILTQPSEQKERK